MTNSVPVTYWFCRQLHMMQNNLAYSDEAEDTLSIIDGSSSSTEWDTPLASEVFLGGFGIKDRHSLSSQLYSPNDREAYGREVTWANTVDPNT